LILLINKEIMLKKILKKCLKFGIIIWAGTASVIAGNPADSSFAGYLYQQGEYYRAITEYHRLLYASEDTGQNRIWLKQIGLCYYQGEDYRGAVSFLTKKQPLYTLDETFQTELNLILAKSYYQLGHYTKAILALQNSNADSPRIHNEVHFLTGISYARLFQWQMAETHFQLIRPSTGKPYRICNAMQLFSDLPERKPILAGTFSAVLPGAGYLYCGREGTALASFVINGLMIWAVRDAIRNDQYGLAAAAGFFGIGWYIGNISGSADAARAYNSHIRHQYLDRMLEKEGCGEYVRKK